MESESPFQSISGSGTTPPGRKRLPLQWMIALPLLLIAVVAFSWYFISYEHTSYVQ